MAKGQKTGGRKKGTPNRMTVKAKEAIEIAAEGLGGVSRMTEWARESETNERIFWSQIYTKLLPLQVTGDSEAPLAIKTIERVIVKAPDKNP